ncbi:IclR family transcriptional regulator [Hyphococcus flavus]|uniref:IclR family transcriptional regulator n=1 Tax=Hyphococcus flavus TaxID=1866326 RepID=A0AAF0CIR9_9PROT|nr:IclR family transcriptional regulator [Hyphococcus flavus]WDI33147.1 IclR family transcriptional regulator [Hyphococcus flavus]
MPDVENGTSSGIKSVSNAFTILEVVAANFGPISLKEISARAGVSPSKAHRYLQSLCACGLLSQAHKSGHYDLGVMAMRMGLAAINRVDVVSRAGDDLRLLADELQADCYITVWSDLGPTIVRFERCKSPTASMIGPGVSLPVFTSAAGQVFLAFGGADFVENLLSGSTDIGAPPGGPEELRRLRDNLDTVRRKGFAHSEGLLMPGRYAVGAPIISIDDNVIAAVVALSKDPSIINASSLGVSKVMEFCRKYSVPKRGYAEETLVEQKIAV